MKLRSQLLLVSLSILVLPWAGCQYIREMEQVMLDGQADVLEGRGQAIAAHLRSELASGFVDNNKNINNASQPLFFHHLSSPPTLDGYADDWPIKPSDFNDVGLFYIEPPYFSTANDINNIFADSSTEVSLNLFNGLYGDNAYLLFTIFDRQPQYHQPQQEGLANGDHIILRVGKDADNYQTYILRANTQGPFSARYENQQGYIRQEHRIRGFWLGTDQGYAIEVRVPKSILGESIDFSYQKANATNVGTASKTDILNKRAPPNWKELNVDINKIVQLYGDRHTNVAVVNTEGWLLGQAGRLSPIDYSVDSELSWQWFLSAVYRFALGSVELPLFDVPIRRGRMDSDEIKQALRGSPDSARYQQRDQRITRTAVPLTIDGRIVGAVALSQTTDTLIEGTNAAFNRLFYYLALAIGVVGFSLITYATLLSFRIRRLSKAADNAIGDDGKIKADFIRSGFGDEVGDLTRSYGQLLARLRDYTDYLRTLASKLSHELRTPLAVVRSSLENLDHTDNKSKAEQYRLRAAEGAERLSNILTAMSSASHMEDSIKHTPMEDFNLDNLITELSQAYSATYSNNKIVCHIEDGNYTMYGSPDLIVQMLDKLVDNAVDFCPVDGEIKLSLVNNKKTLLLSISNNGPLLPDNMQGQLFDSLVSVREGKEKSEQQKTHLGLGLYIVRLIVDFHSGHVQARNLDDGSGVSFDIELPAK